MLFADHTNTQNERIFIQQITNPTNDFNGEFVLVIQDDDGITLAPHLLDEDSIDWLITELTNLKASK